MLCLVTKSGLHAERALTEEEASAVREPLSAHSAAALALAVLSEARENGLWLRCDCRWENDRHSLAAPCRLPKGAGHTWRVLQGGARLQHDIDCVFHRESRDQRAQRAWSRAARMPPEGYFAVLRSREDGKGLTEPSPWAGRRW